MNCSHKSYTVWIEAGSGWFKPIERNFYAYNADEAAEKWANEYAPENKRTIIMIESNATGTIKPYTIDPCKRFDVKAGIPA